MPKGDSGYLLLVLEKTGKILFYYVLIPSLILYQAGKGFILHVTDRRR